MINLLKKHKYKLLTLMLSIVSIFTLFLGINKTYAYETNTFSYTINTTNETFTTIDNKSGIYLDNTGHLFTLNNTTNSNQYLLINFYAIDINTNHIQTSYDNLNVSYIAFRDYTDSRNYGLTTQQRITTTASDYMFTFVYKPYNFSEDINSFMLTFYNISYNYRFLIVNIDYVNYTDIGLSQYYDNYYGQIEDNYNALLSDYNTLQDTYDTLEANYISLQDNYDTLETNYNNLENQTEELNNIGIYGDFYNCSVSVDNTTLTFNQLISNSLLVNNTIYFGKILNYLNVNNTDLKIIYINFNKRLNTNNINYTYWDEVSGIYFDLNMIDDNDEEYITSYSNNVANPQIINSVMLNNDQVPTGSTTYDINNKIYDQMQFRYSRVLSDNVGLSSSTLYLQGYNVGLNERDKTYDDRIKNLINQVNELNQQNQSQYNSGYQRGLNDGVSQNLESAGMKTLFNSILSYPVNMIKSVFDFEFMGINISSLIMFIISIGIVAFVIKKFL